jgi:hypothetical protein
VSGPPDCRAADPAERPPGLPARITGTMGRMQEPHTGAAARHHATGSRSESSVA